MAQNEHLNTAADIAALSAGLGTIAANREADLLFKATGNPNLKGIMPKLTEAGAALRDIQQLPAQNRALAYADLANKLSATDIPVDYKDTIKLGDLYELPVKNNKMSAGHWILNAQYNLKNYADKSPLVRLLDLIPGLNLRDKVTARYNYYKQPGQLGASFQHYDSFAKSPGHSWFQMINELPDDIRTTYGFMPDNALSMEEFNKLSPEAKQAYADQFPDKVPAWQHKIAIAPNGRLLSPEEIKAKGITPNKVLTFQDIAANLLASKDGAARNKFMQELSQLQLPQSDYDWSDYLDRLKNYTGITDEELKKIGDTAVDKFHKTNPGKDLDALSSGAEAARFEAVRNHTAKRLGDALKKEVGYGVSLQQHLMNKLRDYMSSNFLTTFADEVAANPDLQRKYGNANLFRTIVDGKKNDKAANRFLDLLSTDRDLFDRYLKKMTVPMLDAASLGPVADFAKTLSGIRMKNAYKGYGKVAPAVKALAAVKHPVTLGLGSLAALVGGYNLLPKSTPDINRWGFDEGLFKKSSVADSHSSSIPFLESALGLGLAVPSWQAAAQQIHEDGWRKLNPFSKGNVIVLGGTETDILDADGKPSGERTLLRNSSFNAQRAAAAEKLKDSGLLNITEKPLYYEPGNISYKKNKDSYNALRDTFKPISLSLAPSELKDVDAVYQLGAHPEAYKLGKLSDDGHIVRYRQLTDFGSGNFKQPEQWIGSTNWMGVLDDVKGHDRFVVPGSTEGVPAGKKKNLSVDNISVDEGFYGNTKYAPTKEDFYVPVADAEKKVRDLKGEESPKLKPGEFIREKDGKRSVWTKNNVPAGHIVRKDSKGIGRIYAPGAGGHWMTMGGGAGAFLPIMEAANPDDSKAFLKNKRMLIDDWATAIRTNNATAADKLHILLGGAANQDNEVTRMYKYIMQWVDDANKLPQEEFLRKYRSMGKSLALERYLNAKQMKIWQATKGMADIYRNAKSVTMLPGSTGAEAMRMGGEHLPRFINMIPDETIPWMPKHWSENAKVYADHLGSKNINISDVTGNRIKQIQEIIGDGSPIKRVKAPAVYDVNNVARTLANDIRLKKLINLGKFSGKAALGLTGLGIMGHGLYDMIS